MKHETDIYLNPLVERYASREMLECFAPDTRYRAWRKLWIALAEAESELGLDIRPEQIDELQETGHEVVEPNDNYWTLEDGTRIRVLNPSVHP